MNSKTLLLSLPLFIPIQTMVAKTDNPNVIVIYIDDMGIGDLSCYGSKIVKTPNIDQLAEKGIRFTQYYSASPVSSPSRVGLTTGQFPLCQGFTTFQSSRMSNARLEQVDFLDDKAPSMARAFQQAGYATAHIGKWHMGGGRDVKNAPSIKKYGFDEYVSTWESPDPDPKITASNWIWSDKDEIKRWNRTEYFVDKSLDFIKRNKNRPFFLNLWPDDMHTPWVAECFAKEPKTFEERRAFIPVLQEMDKQIGRFLNELHKMGLDKNTIIVFTSDNGPSPSFNQERTIGLRGTKNSNYEGGIRMPFIISYPRRFKKGIIDKKDVICSVDLYPTLCSLAGISKETGYKGDGEDVSEAFNVNNSFSREKDLMWNFGSNCYFNFPADEYHEAPHLAIRRGDMKLLVNSDGTDAQLYDLNKDQYETKNIIAENKTLAKDMQKSVISWYKSNRIRNDESSWKMAFHTVKNKWSIERVNKWYESLPWLVGCNYYPATAINQIEMWQKSTWDPKTIDKELSWAKDYGINTLRVFLHNLVWQADETAFYERMDQFLDICKKYGIKPSFVFFDDCHAPTAKLGVQPLPVKAYHNSGWVNCPVREMAWKYAKNRCTKKEKDNLKDYVQHTLNRFKNDDRVLYWELYNEPGRGSGSLSDINNSIKGSIGDFSNKLLYDSWTWARQINPSQPICATSLGSVGERNTWINNDNSDILSIHCYSNAEKLENVIKEYKKYNRPIIVTEWLARTQNSTVESCLPILKKYKVGAVNWGFVSGKTATIWPWNSRKNGSTRRNLTQEREAGNVIQPNETMPEPPLWFHDLVRPDGTPYSQTEKNAFIELTKGNKKF